ncbi:MAG: thiosulfate/3-mercaptopyruvate sulfurtransferase [Thiomicrorhabdus sp.]|nr:MAG: thiosulfate/3-mercaptopyruvate sulfurtransferase [Thiomicrorhabdus sp.]
MKNTKQHTYLRYLGAYLSALLLTSYCSSVFAANFYSAMSLRVSPSELIESTKNAKEMNRNNVVILDVRPAVQYQQGHIPDALNLPTAWIMQANQLIQPYKMQTILQKLGINTLDKIILYDDGHFSDAARVFWSLEVYGIHHVQVLEHGYQGWQQQQQPTSQIEPKVEESDYTPNINPNVIAYKLQTFIATHNPNQTIIDIRQPQAYQGKTSSTAFFGHIPTAINIPSAQNFDNTLKQRKLHSIENLTKLYQRLSKTALIILYGAKGQDACVSYFALRELNYNVTNFDGAWQAWSNDPQLTITTPQKE